MSDLGYPYISLADGSDQWFFHSISGFFPARTLQIETLERPGVHGSGHSVVAARFPVETLRFIGFVNNVDQFRDNRAALENCIGKLCEIRNDIGHVWSTCFVRDVKVVNSGNPTAYGWIPMAG